MGVSSKSSSNNVRQRDGVMAFPVKACKESTWACVSTGGSATGWGRGETGLGDGLEELQAIKNRPKRTETFIQMDLVGSIDLNAIFVFNNCSFQSLVPVFKPFPSLSFRVA